jgi:flagellar hook-associated protein 1 FlgK
MGGLFASLHLAGNALNSYSQALGVDQSNIANASTPGYASQRASILPISASGIGGSDFMVVSSTGDSRTDALVQASSSQASYSQSQTQQLSSVNQLFDITGSSGILAAFQQFSTAFSNLSVTPNDPTLGAAALTAAGNVASAFRSVATSLGSQSNHLNTSIQSATAQINALAGKIRQLNIQTTGGAQNDPGVDANLRSDLDQLSSLVDITVTKAPDGSVSVLAGGQLPLVVGDQSYSLSADPSATSGSQVTSSAGGKSPSSFSGQLGALLDTQNGTFSELLGSNGKVGTLNSLASGFASQVNALLSSGFNASGVVGKAIFSYGGPGNAASTLALDPTVTPDQLGLATQGTTPEANGVANQLAILVSSNAPGQPSFQDQFGSIAASIGQHLSDARNASTADQTSLTAAQAARQQQSGVSLDQEAVTITSYQRSYDAEARVFSILDQLTSDTINMISGTL